MSNLPENPYAAPTVEQPQAEDNSLQALRREYLNHETSVKGMGFLYLLGGGLIGSVMIVALYLTLSDATKPSGMQVAIMAGILVYSILQALVGYSIRKLAPWSRDWGIVLALPGLILVPVGTVVSIYFLVLLVSKKGRMVFSPEYAQAIAETPEIRYRTSIWVWIILGAFLLFLLFAIFGSSF